jgi:hypothetical protein
MTYLTDFAATSFPVSETLVIASILSRWSIVHPLSQIRSLDTMPHQDNTTEVSASVHASRDTYIK